MTKQLKRYYANLPDGQQTLLTNRINIIFGDCLDRKFTFEMIEIFGAEIKKMAENSQKPLTTEPYYNENEKQWI